MAALERLGRRETTAMGWTFKRENESKAKCRGRACANCEIVSHILIYLQLILKGLFLKFDTISQSFFLKYINVLKI